MKHLFALALSLLLLASCSPGGSRDYPRIPGSKLAAFLTDHPDWSARGPIVDPAGEYILIDAEWVRNRIGSTSGEDCDDHAAAAWREALRHGRPAFGMVTTPQMVTGRLVPSHALNFFVSKDMEIWLYEPQTRTSWKPSREELWCLGFSWV